MYFYVFSIKRFSSREQYIFEYSGIVYKPDEDVYLKPKRVTEKMNKGRKRNINVPPGSDEDDVEDEVPNEGE